MMGKAVHGLPSGQQFRWAEHDIGAWGAVLEGMGVTDILLCSDSDNVVKTWPEWNGGPYEGMSISEVLAKVYKVRTVLRINNWLVGELFTDMHTVELLSEQLGRHDMEAIVCVGNEPRLKEWVGPEKNKKYDPPPDWFTRYNDWFYHNAGIIERCGGTPGYACAPNQTQSPYALANDDQKQAWVDGRYIYCGHFYPHDTPPSFPFTDWVQTGAPMSEAEYEMIVGPLRDVPPWNEHPLEVINQRRRDKAGTPSSIWDITVFWKEWLRHLEWMEQAFGQQVRICATEGGWTPGATLDGRMPPITPPQVAGYTKYVMEYEDNPLEFACVWALVSDLVVQGIGWDNDVWFTTNPLFRSLYNQWQEGDPELLKYAMPVVLALMENGCGWREVERLTERIKEIVDGN
jgi:hypothetical protein